MGWFLWWEVCCVNIALTIHQKYTCTFFLFTERSRLFLQSTEQSLCCGKLSLVIPLPGLGQFTPMSVLPQDIFLYFGSLWFTLCSWESQNSSSPPQEQAGCWGQREPWKWAESETENIDIGQSPAQRPQNDNVLMVLYFSLNYEVK